MNKLKLILISLIAVAGLAAVMSPVYASAAPKDVIQSGVNKIDKRTKAQKKVKLEDSVAKVVNTALFIVGAISVIMIVFAGIRYVASAGNTTAVKGAKDTIMYSIIGLVVALLAYAIVNFVIRAF